jgi:hypothetical protein
VPAGDQHQPPSEPVPPGGQGGRDPAARAPEPPAPGKLATSAGGPPWAARAPLGRAGRGGGGRAVGAVAQAGRGGAARRPGGKAEDVDKKLQELQRKTDEQIDKGKIRGPAADQVREAVVQFSQLVRSR